MATVGQILSSIMEDNRDASTLPERLVAMCELALPISGVGLALMSDDGHEGVVAATDGPARLMEDLQFTLGEGPCVDASQKGSPVLQPNLVNTGQSRWPGFGPAVLEAGIAAIFAFPLQVGAIRLGVLDLYRDTSGNLNNEELSDALAFAEAAVTVLLHLQEQMEPGETLHPQLADALGHRPEIHQATGIISVQAVLGLAEALLLLRAHSFAADRPLMDVALDVVARKLRFHQDDRHHE